MGTTATKSAWLIPPRGSAGQPDGGELPRLFCLPHAGAGASVFRLWPEGLADVAEVWRIQPPGREMRLREPAHRNLDEALDVLEPLLLPLLDRPYALFGHSLGALTAFQLTRRLRAAGHPLPTLLIASACRDPQLPHAPAIHELPDDAFLAELERRYGGMPAELTAHPELLALLLPILRADMAQYASYTHADEPPLDVPITIFRGRDDGWVRTQHLDGWSALSTGPVPTESFDGDHFFVQHQVQDVLAAVRRRLAGAG